MILFNIFADKKRRTKDRYKTKVLSRVNGLNIEDNLAKIGVDGL